MAHNLAVHTKLAASLTVRSAECARRGGGQAVAGRLLSAPIVVSALGYIEWIKQNGNFQRNATHLYRLGVAFFLACSDSAHICARRVSFPYLDTIETSLF